MTRCQGSHRAAAKATSCHAGVLLALVFLSFSWLAARAHADTLSYVGTAQCTACHQSQWEAWRSSHHDLAWTEPTAETVLGDFDDTSFEHQGVVHRFTQEDGVFYMETDGPDGELVRYKVVGVVGITPLQQYLFEIEAGRLQAHDVSWDTEEERWYHLYPDQELDAGDGLHWTGPYKNWNSRCAECHATGFEKRYTPIKREYESRQSEIGVGCEACHGPGSSHIAWASGAASAADSNEAGGYGFTANFTPADPEVEIQQCAGCHSRREPLTAESPLPGTPFHDSYRLALLRQGLYHADGTILEEVYVYGSILQSKMYANGVRCTDCHDPHRAEVRVRGNGLCTQCHSEAGNDRFPSLQLADYDTPDHHFHEPGTAGAQCVSCHMIERDYMQIDGRRDHSFRIPRPDLSEETGAPNACTDCHGDKTAVWAAAQIAQRFPDSVHRGPHFSQTFAAARMFPGDNVEELLTIASDTNAAAIVRATALEMLRGVTNEDVAAASVPLLADAHPLVRENAIGLQRGSAPAELLGRVLPLTDDSLQSVRIAAARALIGIPVNGASTDAAQSYRGAMQEFQRSLAGKADFPETHLVLGGTGLVMRNASAAEAAFREAVLLDPQLEDAWSMIIQLRLAAQDIDGARKTLEEALRHNPSSLQLIQLELGLSR